MALEFFRRRQRMVILIMVLLMVAFLVPSGISMLLSRDPMDAKIGRARFGELSVGDRMSAQAELDILQGMGMGSMHYPPWPTEGAYLLLGRNPDELEPLAYALLVAEARDAGILVGESDVDAFFADIGYGQEGAYEDLIATLRASPQAWTEPMVRSTVANWLRVNKAFGEQMVNCPPSEAEIAVTYRDLQEAIKLRALRLRAEDFLPDVGEPNQAQVLAHFERYRTQFAGQGRRVDEFGFGYRQPGRARLRHLLIRGDVIRRVTEPAFDLVADYYAQNKAEFVKEVPIGPDTRPSGADANGASQPATQPTRKAQMTFAEAKEQIAERLREEAVRSKLDELAALVEREVRRLLAGAIDPNRVYPEAVQAMTRGADAELQRPLAPLKLENRPLKEAIRRLAEAAKLDAICYPWGTHGKQTLLPDVKVSLSTEGMTVGAALEEIGKQVKWPKLYWATCAGFRNVLFSVEDRFGAGVDFFPLQAGQTPLSTFQDLAQDPILGYAYANPAQGVTLAQIIFTAKGLSPDPRQTPLVKVGAEGQRMYVVGDKPGRLLWRLLDVVQSHVPARLDDRPELRAEVARDLKIVAAFDRAVQQAETVRKGAEEFGLETVAARQGKQVVTTDFFTRMQLDMRTLSLQWSAVPELEPDRPELQATVIQEAFKLAPKSLEPNAPPEPPAVGVVPLKPRGEVLVMERADFRPLVAPEYTEGDKLWTARLLGEKHAIELQRVWFDVRAITRRVEFTTQQ